MDGGYAGSDLVLWVMHTSHWFLRVVRCPDAPTAWSDAWRSFTQIRSTQVGSA
jgi:hypothetical protein